MDFSDNPRKTQTPTIEHLQPKCLGGGNGLDNLVLCHPGCNRQLANRPREDKERLRSRRLQRMQREENEPVRTAAVAGRGNPVPVRIPVQRDWKRIALIAIGAAMFLAGVSVGMLID